MRLVPIAAAVAAAAAVTIVSKLQLVLILVLSGGMWCGDRILHVYMFALIIHFSQHPEYIDIILTYLVRTWYSNKCDRKDMSMVVSDIRGNS